MATASQSGQYLFKMIPAKGSFQEGEYVVTREAAGFAYQLEEDGAFTELWKVSGWYSFKVFLSNDGQYLVRMGPWSIGHEPDENDLAVAFYRRGQLIRSYSTADLVEDESAVLATVSHYLWLAGSDWRGERKRDPEAELRLDWEDTFHLKTIDGISYEFDARTGQIKSKQRTGRSPNPDRGE